MISVGLDERVYPVGKLAMIVDLLAREGVPAEDALRGVKLTERALHLGATRISLTQVLQACRNAAELSPDAHFAFHTGLRFHVSTYGMYGFAIFSSTNYRQAVEFALEHQQLATPLVAFSFREEHRRGVWILTPLPYYSAGPRLFKFLLELELGAIISLHRDVMGASFAPKEIQLPFAPPRDAEIYPRMLGCRVLFGRSEGKLILDAAWLDRENPFRNELAYMEMVKLCDALMEELKLRTGIAGKVRELLLMNGMQPTSFESLANGLHMTGRTLRRKLRDEKTSFRKIVDELRMHVAAKYLRETELTIREIAHCVGFSEDAAFRHAFRRWTRTSPREFRGRLRNEANPRLRTNKRANDLAGR
jgi:AraC-like DNA-binding protein